MADVFKVEKVRFCEIFCKGVSFEIPPYQRPYAWEDKQIDDLWSDFINAKNSDYPEYLLGTVYLQEKEVNSYYILDGQQRFISMYLFLKILEYDNLPKLTIGKNDQEFFKALLSNHTDKLKPTTASQKRLQQALNNFQSKEEDKDGLLCFIKEKVSVIKTIITDDKLAITTFITQTDRGKRLTNLEKLKSILYYYQLKIGKHEENLEEIFGEIYNSLNILYEQPETSEADILRVLMVRLEQDQIYRLKDFKNLVKKEVKPDLSWEAGDDVIFDWINKVFSFSLLDEKIQEALERCINIIKEINKALKFYVDYIEKNRQLKHILLSLNPSRFSRAWLVDYLNMEDVQSESLFTYRENIWAIGEKNIPKMPDEVPSELNEYKKEIEDRINRYKTELKEKNLLHLIEIIELSCWKVSKRPISWFLNYNNTNLIQKLVDFSKYHKEKYMLRDLGYGNYRYILMEYEVFWNSDLDIKEFYSVMAEGNEVTKVHREHIFAQNPQEEICNTIKTEGFGDNKSSYDNWIWNIGNIALLTEGDNIKVSNKTPMAKAKDYKEQSKFKTTQKLGKDIEKYCNNNYNLIKTMLELREYELKMFIMYRF